MAVEVGLVVGMMQKDNADGLGYLQAKALSSSIIPQVFVFL